MIPVFVPGGVGAPELLILLVVFAIFLVFPILLIVGIVKSITGRRNAEKITALERRVEELEDEQS